VLDLDWRPMFWSSPEQASTEYDAMLDHVTVAVGNRAEVEVAVGTSDPDEAATRLLDRGVELALVKIRASDSTRAEVLKLVELSRGRVVDLADGSVIVEVTGTESEVDAFIALVRTYGIKELVRTGAVVMARGSGSIEEAIKR
jgi:acetolactate synthase small subunit